MIKEKQLHLYQIHRQYYLVQMQELKNQKKVIEKKR